MMAVGNLGLHHRIMISLPLPPRHHDRRCRHSKIDVAQIVAVATQPAPRRFGFAALFFSSRAALRGLA